LRVYPSREPREPAWCHVEERQLGSFRLLRDDGEPLLEAEGVAFQLLDPERGFLALAPDPRPATPPVFGSAGGPAPPALTRVPSLFVATWPERPTGAADPRARDWLLVSDTELRAEPLILALQARGDRAEHWSSGVESEPGALRRRVTAWLEQRQGGEIGVVFLSGLGSSPGLGSGARAIELALEPATERSCAVALGLIQALAAPAAGVAPRLCFVTRGARAVTPGAAVPGLARAPLWGLARAVPLEEPRLRCVAVDLDPARHALGAVEAEALARELALAGTENGVALRGGARHVERLDTLPCPARRAPPIHSGASYLITGGLGGLGLALCQSLVERGARQLVLASRSGASAGATACVERLRARGVTLLCASLDVGQPLELAALLERIRRELPPLDGVFHAAGVIEDALLRTQSDAGLLRVLRPKLRGAWNLHQQTQREALSHFVSFSSLASLCGSPGQAAYGAANAFLDALAHHRRQQGLCALSVNFGAFAEVGMAARQTPQETARRASWGLGAMDPEAGLEAMYQLLGGELAQAAVAHVDAKAWLSEPSPYRGLSLCEFLGPARASYRPEAPSEVGGGPASRVVAGAPTPRRGRLAPELAELSTCSASSRSARLLQHVRERVAQTLNMVSPDAVEVEVPLLELGMDSLMGVELAHRLGSDLGLRLASTLVYDCPTAAALAAELERQWRLTTGDAVDSGTRAAAPATAEPSPGPAPPRPVSGPAPRVDLEQLNDEQLRALVDEMVARR
jgi:NAD(P)-dependent dehydrogenase (short-subunit alcohol dehydrogenase family)/acyl carrier protein